MASPSGITLTQTAAADIPTPATGKDTLFINSATTIPAYKDDAGATHTLLGPTGATGATGPTGPTGATSPTGPTGANTYTAKGSVALIGGTKTIATAAALTTGNYHVQCHTLGTVATAGPYTIASIVNGVSFDITSAAPTETSTVDWIIF